MKRKILSASAKVFLEKGYAGASSKMVADLVGVSNGSPFFHYGNKEGVLLEFVKRMFTGQFRTVEHMTGGDNDPLLLYGMETTLQMHIVEISEPLRELYVTAYTLPSTSKYINEGMAKKLAVIFGSFLPRATEQDWALLELAAAGIMRSFMAQPCTEELTMERKLRSYLSSGYKLFDVPAERYEPLIEQILRVDFAPKAREIIAKTVRKVDEEYAAAMTGTEVTQKE